MQINALGQSMITLNNRIGASTKLLRHTISQKAHVASF